MKSLKIYIVGALIALFGVLAFVPAESTYAAGALDQICSQTGQNDSNVACQNRGDDAGSFIGTIIDVLIFVIAAVAVVMIIYGGILFTTSAGNANLVKRAKDTITYSVVGLVVAVLAYAIVHWVLDIF
jgi:hypothetical protein